MNLICVLISFGLVNVMGSSLLERYIREVINTNMHMVQESVDLPRVIRNIVRAAFTMEQISLMLAVIPQPQHHNILDLIQYQLRVQEIIEDETGHYAPRISGVFLPGMPNRLAELGDARRTFIKSTTITIISILLATNQNEERPMKYFEDSLEMCRLIGLFRSTEYPNAYTKDAVIDGIDTCTLTDINDNQIRYISILGDIWSLTSDNRLDKPLADEFQ